MANCCWLISVLPARAIDMHLPARLRVVVRDASGQSLSGAVVTVSAPEDETEAARGAAGAMQPLRRVADARGVVELALRHPEGDAARRITWSQPLRAETQGRMAYVKWLTFFPGGRFEEQVTLQPRQTTLIRLLGSHGQPLAGVEMQIVYTDAVGPVSTRSVKFRTGERGEYLFAHPPLHDSFSISSGRVRRSGTATPEVTLTVNEDDLPAEFPVHRLEVRLIGPDGAPAAGWFVAQQVKYADSRSKIGPVFMLDIMTHQFAVRDLLPVGPDGGFHLDRAGEWLVVISPQGVPFLFRLTPRFWPDPVRRLTLRLPPLRRVHRGQLFAAGGRPAAGARVVATRARSQARNWELEFLPPAARLLPSTLTDAQGRYEIPVYYGEQVKYGVADPHQSAETDLAANPRTRLEPWDTGTPPVQKSALKQVTLVFTDAQRRRITGMGVGDYECYAAGRQVGASHEQDCPDARGSNLFVAARADRLTIGTKARGWKPFTRSLQVSGGADRTLTGVVPETLRWRPLRGLVLDVNGRPAPGVPITLHATISLHGLHGSGFATLRDCTRSDAAGRFFFAGAPDECQLRVYESAEGEDPAASGWAEPPPVTAQQRHVTIRLQRCGSVRVLLPEPIRHEPNPFTLQSPLYSRSNPIGPAHNQPDSDRPGASYAPLYEDSPPALFFPCVRPGSYLLKNKRRFYRTVSDTAVRQVKVKAAEQTTIDMRDGSPGSVA